MKRINTDNIDKPYIDATYYTNIYKPNKNAMVEGTFNNVASHVANFDAFTNRASELVDRILSNKVTSVGGIDYVSPTPQMFLKKATAAIIEHWYISGYVTSDLDNSLSIGSVNVRQLRNNETFRKLVPLSALTLIQKSGLWENRVFSLDVSKELNSWGIDPSDILTIQDAVSVFQQKGHYDDNFHKDINFGNELTGTSNDRWINIVKTTNEKVAFDITGGSDSDIGRAALFINKNDFAKDSSETHLYFEYNDKTTADDAAQYTSDGTYIYRTLDDGKYFQVDIASYVTVKEIDLTNEIGVTKLLKIFFDNGIHKATITTIDNKGNSKAYVYSTETDVTKTEPSYFVKNTNGVLNVYVKVKDNIKDTHFLISNIYADEVGEYNLFGSQLNSTDLTELKKSNILENANLSLITQKIDKAEKDIANIEQQTTQIAKNKTDIDNIKPKVTQLGKDVTKNTTDISINKKANDTNTTNISTNKQNITTLDGKVIKSDGRQEFIANYTPGTDQAPATKKYADNIKKSLQTQIGQLAGYKHVWNGDKPLIKDGTNKWTELGLANIVNQANVQFDFSGNYDIIITLTSGTSEETFTTRISDVNTLESIVLDIDGVDHDEVKVKVHTDGKIKVYAYKAGAEVDIPNGVVHINKIDQINGTIFTLGNSQEDVDLYNDGNKVGKANGTFTSKDTSGRRQIATDPDDLTDKKYVDDQIHDVETISLAIDEKFSNELGLTETTDIITVNRNFNHTTTTTFEIDLSTNNPKADGQYFILVTNNNNGNILPLFNDNSFSNLSTITFTAGASGKWYQSPDEEEYNWLIDGTTLKVTFNGTLAPGYVLNLKLNKLEGKAVKSLKQQLEDLKTLLAAKADKVNVFSTNTYEEKILFKAGTIIASDTTLDTTLWEQVSEADLPSGYTLVAAGTSTIGTKWEGEVKGHTHNVLRGSPGWDDYHALGGTTGESGDIPTTSTGGLANKAAGYLTNFYKAKIDITTIVKKTTTKG